ncbi:hypothetical protein ACWKWC_11745 [Geodermatophilus nigrescens]
MDVRRPTRPRTVSRRRLAVLGVLTPLATVGVLAAAGPAGAVPFEGDPGTTHCVRLVTWAELTGEPGVPGGRQPGTVPLVAVLVPLSEC